MREREENCLSRGDVTHPRVTRATFPSGEKKTTTLAWNRLQEYARYRSGVSPSRLSLEGIRDIISFVPVNVSVMRSRKQQTPFERDLDQGGCGWRLYSRLSEYVYSHDIFIIFFLG